MKIVNWTEAAQSAELLVHDQPPALLEATTQYAGCGEIDERPSQALWQSWPLATDKPTFGLADTIPTIECQIENFLQDVAVRRKEPAAKVVDPTKELELAALRADLVALGSCLEQAFNEQACSGTAPAASLDRLRSLGDSLSFAAYTLGLWGPGCKASLSSGS